VQLNTIKENNLHKIGFQHSRDFEVVPPAFDVNAGKLVKTRALSAQATSYLRQPKRFTDIIATAQAKVHDDLNL